MQGKTKTQISKDLVKYNKELKSENKGKISRAKVERFLKEKCESRKKGRVKEFVLKGSKDSDEKKEDIEGSDDNEGNEGNAGNDREKK